MRLGEVQVREDILGGIAQQRRGLGEAGHEPVGHALELRAGRGVVGLGEERAHKGRDQLYTAAEAICRKHDHPFR